MKTKLEKEIAELRKQIQELQNLLLMRTVPAYPYPYPYPYPPVYFPIPVYVKPVYTPPYQPYCVPTVFGVNTSAINVSPTPTVVSNTAPRINA